MKNGGNHTKSGLEPALYFHENRRSGYDLLLFSRNLCGQRKVVKAGPKMKAVLDGFLTLPMVLPPTVAGFFLLLIFSRRRPFGIFLFEQFHIKVVQTWLGCIIAATVIAFPLMYRNARAAFEQI